MEIYYYSCIRCNTDFPSKLDDPDCPICGCEDVEFVRILNDEETEGLEYE